jgi:hypothetical protein
VLVLHASLARVQLIGMSLLHMAVIQAPGSGQCPRHCTSMCRASGFASLWGFGSSLVDSVAKNATTLVNTIVETDWQKELADIQQGLKEDTQQIEETVERRLGWQRADGAGTSEGGSNARDASSGSPPGAHGGLGFSLAALGQSFVTGTTELFEQVRVVSVAVQYWPCRSAGHGGFVLTSARFAPVVALRQPSATALHEAPVITIIGIRSTRAVTTLPHSTATCVAWHLCLFASTLLRLSVLTFGCRPSLLNATSGKAWAHPSSLVIIGHDLHPCTVGASYLISVDLHWYSGWRLSSVKYQSGDTELLRLDDAPPICILL